MILAAITVSLLVALFYPQPQLVVRYLYAQLYGTLLLFAVNWRAGDTSTAYLAAYATVTAVILATVGRIVWDAVLTRQNSWKAVGIVSVLAVTLGRMAFLGLGRLAEAHDYIVIVEGTLLFAAGLTVGFLAPYVERMGLAFLLAGLWMAQSFFRLGFALHITDGQWMENNWRVPPALGISAFLLIGWLGRRRLKQTLRIVRDTVR